MGSLYLLYPSIHVYLAPHKGSDICTHPLSFNLAVCLVFFKHSRTPSNQDICAFLQYCVQLSSAKIEFSFLLKISIFQAEVLFTFPSSINRLHSLKTPNGRPQFCFCSSYLFTELVWLTILIFLIRGVFFFPADYNTNFLAAHFCSL